MIVPLFDFCEAAGPMLLGLGSQLTAEFFGQYAGVDSAMQTVPVSRLVENDLKRKENVGIVTFSSFF